MLGSVNAECTTYDVGIIPDAYGCPPNAEQDIIEVYTDDEDERNESETGGWVGSVWSGENTWFHFCRVDGTQFYNRSNDPSKSEYHYAVLKLGTNCPNGSYEFSRYLDGEDDANRSTKIGDIWPGEQNGQGTRLRFCMFRGGAPTMAMFPSLGYAYGLFAPSNVTGTISNGYIRTDDEDVDNNNTYECGSYCSDAQRIVEGGSNTVFHVARVR